MGKPFKTKNDAKKALEILEWKNDNNASYTDCEKHWNISRKSVSRWENKWGMDGIKDMYGLHAARTESIESITEKSIPPELLDKAERALSNLTDLSEMTSRALKLWVQHILDKINETGIKSLNIYELDRLIKINADANKHTLPSTETTTENKASLYESTKLKLSESRKQLQEKFGKLK